LISLCIDKEEPQTVNITAVSVVDYTSSKEAEAISPTSHQRQFSSVSQYKHCNSTDTLKLEIALT